MRTSLKVVGLLIVAVGVICVIVVVAMQFASRSDVAVVARRVVDPLPSPPPAAQGYVGSRVCASCHEEIFDRYQSHSMAHSMSKIEDALTIEDYQHAKFSPPGPRCYSIERTPEGVFHHELLANADGEPIYDQAEQIRFALGSGKRGRSYLIEKGGILFQSPISWYSPNEQWDLAPGFVPQGHQRFERRVGDACLYCHAGRVNGEQPGSNRYREPPFRELSIGCERCHGPGQRHVEHQTKSPTDSTEDVTIVNPARLPMNERESVCNQCHLQGKFVVRRFGRGFMDFRPGQRMDDVFCIFTTGLNDAASERRAVSQVEQMWSSKCFRASGGEMGCTSCHDPHSSPAQDQRTAFYNRGCLKCHDEPDCALDEAHRRQPPAEGSCIHCHMPRAASSDIPHTPQTDHRILRSPEKTSATASPVATPGELQMFADSEQQMSRREINRAKGLATMLHVRTTQDRDAARRAARLLTPAGTEDDIDAILHALTGDAEVLETLGLAFALSDRPAYARRCWQKLLAGRPEDETVLHWMIVFSTRAGDDEQTLEFLDRYLKVNPHLADTHSRKADVLVRLNRPQEAIRAAERALSLNPTLMQLRLWLVGEYERQGQADKQRLQQTIIDQMRAAFDRP